MKKILVFFFILTAVSFSQELNCKVTVNMDNLTNASRDLLSDFQNTISDYLNKTRFTSQDWQGDRINCSITVLFLTGTTDFNYTAQVIVSSQRPVYRSVKNTLMLSINDPNWIFSYQKGQGLFLNQNSFTPLTSFLDYYAYMIIGFDMESDYQFGGTPFFNKAINIVNLATTSSSSKGWIRTSGTYSRQALVEDLLNDKYRPFREAFYQYYYGIDIFPINHKIGQQKIIYLINTIYSMRDKIDFLSILIKTFFDARSGEIVEYLKGYPDSNIYTILKKIDPSHTSRYDAAINAAP